MMGVREKCDEKSRGLKPQRKGLNSRRLWSPPFAKCAKDGAPTAWRCYPKAGPPSITVSALSRDTSTYRRFFFFLWWKVLVLVLLLGLLLLFAHATKARFQNPAVDVWFHQPSIRSLISDHDSLCRLPDFFGEARRPISPTMSYSFTRVAHGLPCMRTSCA